MATTPPFGATDAFFSAEFPSAPRREVQTIKSATTVSYLSETDDALVGVGFSDFSGRRFRPQDDVVLAALKGVAEQNQGTITWQARTQFAGADALDGVIEYSDGVVQYVRIVLLPPGHLYTLTQVSAQGSERSREFKRLLTSFRHLPA